MEKPRINQKNNEKEHSWKESKIKSRGEGLTIRKFQIAEVVGTQASLRNCWDSDTGGQNTAGQVDSDSRTRETHLLAWGRLAVGRCQAPALCPYPKLVLEGHPDIPPTLRIHKCTSNTPPAPIKGGFPRADVTNTFSECGAAPLTKDGVSHALVYQAS